MTAAKNIHTAQLKDYFARAKGSSVTSDQPFFYLITGDNVKDITYNKRLERAAKKTRSKVTSSGVMFPEEHTGHKKLFYFQCAPEAVAKIAALMKTEIFDERGQTVTPAKRTDLLRRFA